MRSIRIVAGGVLACMLIVLFAVSAIAAPNEVLILESTVTSPASSSREYYWVQQAGFTPVVVNNATWGAMTAAQFTNYEAIVLGDPGCASDTTPVLAAIQNQAIWNSVVDGNVMLIGTDQTFHATQGGDSLMKYGIQYVTANAGSGETGLFASLSCYFTSASLTQVTMFDSLSALGIFKVFSSQCHNNAHIVVTHPALTNLSDSILSNWSCSTHELFDTWPSDFLVLAIGRNLGTYTAIDGSVGQPYILVRGEGFTSTRCVNAPDSLKNWWPLNEVGSPAADIRGNNDSGLWVGSPAPIAGKVAGALQFDGVADQVNVANGPEVNIGTGDFSIDAWIRTAVDVGTIALVDKTDPGTVTGWSLIVQNGFLGFQMADGTGSTFLSTAFVADNTWHLVAVTVDRSSVTGLKFYVDGAPAGVADPTIHSGSLTNTNQLVFGARSATGANRYTGDLDEIEMFNRELAAFDVYTLYLADSLGKCPQDVVVGACCLPDFSCILAIGQTECDDLGGSYLGDGTLCTPTACDPFLVGACCLPDGSCIDSVSYPDCDTLYGGLFQGLYTTCATSECLIQGACCLDHGVNPGGLSEGDTCMMTMGAAQCEAMGGIYLGDSTTCASAICDTCICYGTGDIDNDNQPLTPLDLEILTGIVYGWIPPIDSMCHADVNGDCIVDQADIDLMTCFLNNGPSCFIPYGGYPVLTCCDPSTVTGACCMQDTCMQYAAPNCLEGTYLGDGSVCTTPNICPPDSVVVIDIDTVIIIIISWPPIGVDTAGPIVVGPFDPGPIGVSFNVGDSVATRWDAKWLPIEDPGTGVLLPPGSFLQFKAYQETPGSKEQAIGTARINKLYSGLWNMEVDFSMTGATTYSVEVFSGDQVVANLQQHTGPAGTATAPPTDWHWSTHTPNGARIQHGCTGTWSTPVEIDLRTTDKDARHVVMADSVKFVPDDQTIPNGYLTRVVISARNIPTIAFDGWSVYHETCCQLRGDADASGSLNVSDLTFLVAYLFQGGPQPPCVEEGDLDASGAINVSDLTYMVAHLFQGGPAPVACP